MDIMSEFRKNPNSHLLVLPRMVVDNQSERIVHRFMDEHNIEYEDAAEIILSFRDSEKISDGCLRVISHSLSKYRNCTVVLEHATKLQEDMFTKTFDQCRQFGSTSLTKDQLIELMKDYPGDAEIVVTAYRTKENQHSYYWKEKGKMMVFSVSNDPNIIVLEA